MNTDQDWFVNVPYRPRYSAEESSDAAYEKDKVHRRCMGRKRRAGTILFVFTFAFVAGIIVRAYLFFINMKGDGKLAGRVAMSTKTNETHSLWGWINRVKPQKKFDLAQSDSYGFFNEIANEDWEKMKRGTMMTIDLQYGIIHRTSDLLSESGANIYSNLWWNDNWKVNFSCREKIRIGGYWICDPIRIASLANEYNRSIKPKRKKRNDPAYMCVVYVSGGNEIEFWGQYFDFLWSRQDQPHSVHKDDLLGCEIHVFAPNEQAVHEARDGLFLHNWGFRPKNKGNMGPAFKTLEETIAELKHSGRISVLALDCEACEWDIYKDILSLKEPIQQVLMQMHGTPYMANELFLAMQEAGYVIFNRENNGDVDVWDYSWMKLAPSYFNWKE
ncbi:hypothetical protein ACHAXA_002624 [Cyclostephanos tholiformis]|uniref:Methyltransferase domain-containing protein n=1 Tax=Cyclostephanos tholiformis TaxID=382380 RepID=A0ABD3SCN8_9STRA